MHKQVNQIGSLKLISVIALSALLLCSGFISEASANAVIPDGQKAVLSIRGSGVSPNSQISLSTGSAQSLTTKADNSGNFLFSNLRYASFEDLRFYLDIPSYSNAISENFPSNRLEFKYDGRESIATIQGQIGKSGTLSFSMAGADQSPFQVAGKEGYVKLQARTQDSLASGKSSLTASIVNVAESCCPRLIIPASPILLTISSQPIANATSSGTTTIRKPVRSNSFEPSIPKATTKPMQNKEDTRRLPIIITPKKEAPAEENQEKPKKKIPYIIQGKIDFDKTVLVEDEISAAVSFSAADYDRTYVGGLKRIADEIRRAVFSNVPLIGAFLDGRDMNDTLRALQVSTAQTLVNYSPSNSVCTFGTLSRSLVKADANARANQMAFSKIMMDKNNQKAGTVYAKVNIGAYRMVEDFKTKYCNRKTNGSFLDGYCQNASATPDTLFDRDVDFTRVFDVPLSIDADFTDSAMTDDKQSIIALFSNLSKVDPVMGSSQKDWNPNDDSIMTQDVRSLWGMRNISNNSFAALVSEKVKTTSAASTHMNNIIMKLGLSSADATKLLGANPSYFAQMEVMTKKIFQDPSFYANLYDGEANVDRQRVAMKAIELQQDRDFLESLRRREMLLSVLLNSKLQKSANEASSSGYVRKSN
jgi:hypothetical protein